MEDNGENAAAVIGRKIREELQRLDKTHEWLAGRINRSRAAITFYVNGERMPPPYILERISRVLRPEEGGSVDWLLGIAAREMTDDEKTLLATYRAIRHRIYRTMLQDAADALLGADATLSDRGIPPDV